MKQKPISHRASNTFRFKGFHQKIQEIKVSTREFILRQEENETESITLFWQTVIKWKELNLTVGFKDFVRDLGSECQSVAQLLLNQERIVHIIEAYILKLDHLGLFPVLHILVAFARDIPDIFYEKYFFQFVTKLIGLLKTKNHEIIENIFICLVSLFTLLQKYIKNDISKLYIDYKFCTLFSRQFPWYIKDLAAKSICSIIRKVPLKRKFFLLVLKMLNEDDNEADGVGRLFFHCLKSDVSRRLHSSAPTTLALLLDIIRESDIPKERATNALCVCFKHLAFHVTSANAEFFSNWQVTWENDSLYIWPVIYKYVDPSCNDGDVTQPDVLLLNCYLQLIYTLIEFKEGILIGNYFHLFEHIFNATKDTSDDKIGKSVSKIATAIVCSTNGEKDSELMKYIMENIFKSNFSHNIIFDFIKNILHSYSFDTVILPFAMPYINKISLMVANSKDESSVLNCLGEIIGGRQDRVKIGDEICRTKLYELDFKMGMNQVLLIIESTIMTGLNKDLSNIETLILSCLCLPHISPLEVNSFVMKMLSILNDALTLLPKSHDVLLEVWDIKLHPRKKQKTKTYFSSCPSFNFNIKLDNSDSSRKILYLVSVIIESLYHLLASDEFIDRMTDVDLISFMKTNLQHRECIDWLRSLDIYLTVASRQKHNVICENTLKDIYTSLGPCLCSSQILVRLIAAHIFSIFSLVENTGSHQNMFKIMAEVESIPATPHAFKDRLRIMGHLDSDFVDKCKPKSGFYDQAPLLFLIGQLYVNFKEIWQPVMHSIANYANSLIAEDFWSIWFPKLKISVVWPSKKLSLDLEKSLFENPILEKLHSDHTEHPVLGLLNSRPDDLNFRDLMWQSMKYFHNICESRSSDCVTLFFDFVQKEFFSVDFHVARTQDVSLKKGENLCGETETIIENCSEVVQETDTKMNKAPIKTLCEMIGLFTKFQAAKNIHRSRDLENLYLELLSHPNVKVQKTTLFALLSYNHKYLVSYKESLCNILEDKTFRDEIVLFSIRGDGDDESRSLKEEHRTNFMPILIRILYGKMRHRTGKSRGGGQKDVILRFLAGMNESELDFFFHLSFNIFLNRVEGSALDVVEEIEQYLDPEKIIPIKRMLSALGTVESIFEKIGGLTEENLSFIFKVLILILYTSVKLLDRKLGICSHFIPSLKTLRHLSLQKIVILFDTYENQLSSNDLEALFIAGVWPSLARLPDEGIYCPTPLLQLFHSWAQKTNHHLLLAKYHYKMTTLTPFPYIISLMNHHKCSPAVIDMCYNIIEKLIFKSNQDDAPSIGDVFAPIITDDILPVVYEAENQGIHNLTFGESLVLLNLDGILKSMKNRLISFKKGQIVHNLELSILIHISKWIKNKDIGQELLDLIVALLKKNCIKETEKVTLLLNICASMTNIVENPEKHIDDFLTMFCTVTNRCARTALRQTIHVIASHNTKYKYLEKLVFEFNEWNVNMVDEIDYEVRLQCYKEVGQYLSSADYIDERIINFLIYQNVWTLREVEDLGLKNLGVCCLQTVVEMLLRLQDEQGLSKKILEQVLLPLLRTGLKSKQENVWSSFVIILRAVVLSGHSITNKLTDLFSLSCVDDPDSDFLLNITHIQMSRRTRALNKLADNLLNSEAGNVLPKFQTETITEFLIPIICHFLSNEEYLSEDNLLNGSCRCVGALSGLLPWYPYLRLLKYYLNVFPKQPKHHKLGIKVLEAIINAFHETVCAPSESCSKEEEMSYCNEGSQESVKGSKVFYTVTKVLIPQIQKAMSERSSKDLEHKSIRKKNPEVDNVKRIPLALALVKLLKKLPPAIMDSHVNNILLTLINYLKSRSITVRKEARLMLVKVMLELGGDYLGCVVQDLNSILVRGYQSHVMVFTLYSVITELKDRLLPCHIDCCLKDIIDICTEDIFGDKSQEKEVKKITAKVSEARVEKGYSILGICARTVSENFLETIMVPLKDLLQTTNKKVVSKVGSCLRKIAYGLVRNANIPTDKKSIFVYGILREKIEGLKCVSDSTSEKVRTSADCFLLAPEPKRMTRVAKSSKNVISNVLVEFALNLLLQLLKENSFKHSDSTHCSLLDPYIFIMSEYMQSEHPEITIFAIQIICFLLKYPLPSLKEFVPQICGELFVILNKYASPGLVKGKLFELVQISFRAVTLLIKEAHFYTLAEEHIKVLLHYARSNLDDHSQHNSTFVILESIISHKIEARELHELMMYLRELSITSTNTNMLDNARALYFKYMMKFQRKKKLYTKSLLFFLSNISFAILQGRMSASLMVHDILIKFPRTSFAKETEINIWLKLAEQLSKETSRDHRILIKNSLKELYKKSEYKSSLINNCLKLMEDNPTMNKADNAAIIYMSTQSLLAFLENSAIDHPSLLVSGIIPKVAKLLHPGRYSACGQKEDDLSDNEFHSLDITLNALLELVLKLMDLYSSTEHLTIWTHNIGEEFWNYIQDHLNYPNLKVRIHSAAVFGKHFSMFPVNCKETASVASTSIKVRSLIDDFCNQLKTISPVETPLLCELGKVVVRNLVYLISQGKKVPVKLISKKGELADDNHGLDIYPNEKFSNQFTAGIYMVLHNVGTLAYDEFRKRNKESTLCRESLLNLIAGVIQIIGDELTNSPRLVKFIINHLARELSDQHLSEALVSYTKEVAMFAKEKLGPESFNQEMLRSRLTLEKKRSERKARNKEQTVKNSRLAMKKKAQKQQSKKISKKRKLIELKLKPNKRRNIRDLAMISS